MLHKELSKEDQKEFFEALGINNNNGKLTDAKGESIPEELIKQFNHFKTVYDVIKYASSIAFYNGVKVGRAANIANLELNDIN